ncbi:hypothetical protein M427DRAFT_260537 [Gonapodya prolifera JEL478]|uniref:Uncharacterized protein n=1 Tax=Gonapodya prolifera (strain JEL478) TaxID=1344416 RepID=A0A139AKR9_GONPJ|nr:hypothetical protein M427DRAFT_260537 [Gonapodya prolifera JEL478]|eukprot:KXS17391.1 hypothetical protein M427DRAFT_260537 [Gonapodya prolifera JEL478]
MQVFANDLDREAQLSMQPLVKQAYVMNSRSASPGAQPGAEVDYVSLDSMGTRKANSPVMSEMPPPIPAPRAGVTSRGSWDRT